MHWRIILPGGEMRTGLGPVSGITALAAEAECAVYSYDGIPPIIVAGPHAISWTVDGVVGEKGQRRFWRFELPPGVKLIVWPDGSTFGIGPTLEAVELAERTLAAVA